MQMHTLIRTNSCSCQCQVDGVSSIGALDFRMDDWGVDVAVTGSQKAMSLPTGLAYVAASKKVRGMCEFLVEDLPCLKHVRPQKLGIIHTLP